MGDRIVIEDIRFLYGHLFQIDLYNETKCEYYRTFCEIGEFFKLIADGTKKPPRIPDPNCGAKMDLEVNDGE